jgi:hypothetical protein
MAMTRDPVSAQPGSTRTSATVPQKLIEKNPYLLKLERRLRHTGKPVT